MQLTHQVIYKYVYKMFHFKMSMNYVVGLY